MCRLSLESANQRRPPRGTTEVISDFANEGQPKPNQHSVELSFQTPDVRLDDFGSFEGGPTWPETTSPLAIIQVGRPMLEFKLLFFAGHSCMGVGHCCQTDTRQQEGTLEKNANGQCYKQGTQVEWISTDRIRASGNQTGSLVAADVKSGPSSEDCTGQECHPTHEVERQI
jgi:hypothetical protein